MRLFFFCTSLFFSSVVLASDCEQLSISCHLGRGIPYAELLDVFMWFFLSLLMIGFIFYIFYKIYDATYFQKPKKIKQKSKQNKFIEDDEENDFEDHYISRYERD